MERGDAWSGGSHLMTKRTELRVKVNMLKRSEQKEIRLRGLYDIVSCCPNPGNSYLRTLC